MQQGFKYHLPITSKLTTDTCKTAAILCSTSKDGSHTARAEAHQEFFLPSMFTRVTS